MQILISNNRAGLIQIAHTKGTQPLNLSPGVNSVPLDVWERCREMETTKRLMATKVEVVRGRPVDPETVGKMQITEGATVADDAGLAGLKPATCARIIDGTLDQRLVAKWLGEEKRAEVKKMLEERAKFLAPEPAKKAG